MAEYVALWGRDIDDDSSPVPTYGSSGNGHHEPVTYHHDPSTEPIPVISDGYDDGYTDSNGHGDSNDYAEQESAYVEQESGYDGYVAAEPEYVAVEPEQFAETEQTVRAPSYAEPFIDRRPGSPGDSLTFRSAPTTPWFRTRRGMIVLIAVIAVVLLLALIPTLLRSPGPEAPTNVTPSTEPVPSSVQPPPTGVAPSLTSQPAPPPPPPPPPQDAPVYRPQYPSSRGGSGSQAPKPEINVTRAPISVSPKPVTPPSSAEVGRRNGDN